MCVKQGKDISTFSNVSPSRVQSIVTDDEKSNRQETKSEKMMRRERCLTCLLDGYIE